MMQSMLQHLVQKDLAVHCSTFDNAILTEDYTQWQQQFTWDALKYGIRYGQSFCNNFGIEDNILFYETNQVRADQYIKKTYLAR